MRSTLDISLLSSSGPPADVRCSMALSELVAQQLRAPTGLAGRVMARLMNRANLRMNAAAVHWLAPAPDATILDVGFGGGVSFPLLLSRLESGQVVGIDPSPTMVRRAERRHALEIMAGRVHVMQGEVDLLPLHDESVDAALSVNSAYFWPDLPGALGELRRVLRPGGRLVLVLRPEGAVRASRYAAHGFSIRPDRQYEAELRDAGFRELSVHRGEDRHGGHVCFACQRPAG